MSYETLDAIADAYNPMLFFSVLLFCFLQIRKERFSLRTALSYGVEIMLYLFAVYGLKYLDQRFGLWPGVGWDYSTHTAFALAMTWPLWLYQASPLRWCWPLSFVAYAVLMMYQGYHSFADIISTTVVIGILLFGCQRIVRPDTLHFAQQRTI